MEYPYQTSECALRLFPMIKLKGVFVLDDEKANTRLINRGNYKKGQWGMPTPLTIVGNNYYPFPSKIEMDWFSLTEVKGYSIKAVVDKKEIERCWKKTDMDGNPLYEFIVVGLAPFGGVALWIYGFYKSTMIHWLQAKEMSAKLIKEHLVDTISFSDFCYDSIKQDEIVRQNLEEHGLPCRDFFNNWMKQYQYRYLAFEEYFDGKEWRQYDEENLYYDDLDVNKIYDQRFDGTHNQLNDGGLLKFHEAGCPKRLAVKWYEGGDNLSAYYWFDELDTPQIFSHFFMMDAERTADVLLRIDTRANRYEIALKDNANETLQVMPQEAYQLLVFRNGNEIFRSENYAQEDGAWNW